MPRKHQAEDDDGDDVVSPSVKKVKANRAKVAKPVAKSSAAKQELGKGKDSDGNSYWEVCLLQSFFFCEYCS